MYTALLALQYVGIAVLYAEILYLMYQKTSRLQILMLVVFISALVNFVGYLFEMQATTQEMALQAVKFIYVGKPFIILCIFIFVLEYYQIFLPRILYRILYALHMIVTVSVLTCDYNTWFYNSVSFTKDGIFPHLVLGHGFLYYVLMLLILLYSVVIVAVGVRHFRVNKNPKERMRTMSLMSVGILCICSFLLFLSGVTRGYDITMPAYLISTLILLYAIVHYRLLDALNIAKETIFDDFTDGLLVLDNENMVLYVNSRVEEIYPEIKEAGYEKIIQELEYTIQEGEKLFAGEQVYEVENKEIVKDKISYGKIFIIKDVTQTYHYMTELEQQSIFLQKASKAKTDFLAKMSHEIRTPINSILGMNEMILRESKQPKITEYALDAKTSAGALLGIINDILDTTKIESGKMELFPVDYDIVTLLKTVVNITKVKANEKSLGFEIHVDPNLPCAVYGDDIRLRQILLNLLINAVKFTDKGKVTFEVQCERFDDKVAKLRFTVTDTGIGIKEEDIDKICDEFSRVDELRNREIEGTGLGMSIVQGLLRLMDSKIEIQSVYGEGSTFSFEIMQKITDVSSVGEIDFDDAHAKASYVYNSVFVAPGARVLVVDDNKINRKVFRGLLKATQMEIVDVSSGQECLDLVAKEHFDLIFLDHMMPEMDGIETLHAMKAMDNNYCKDTPIIVLTANAVVGAREMYLKEGFDEFMAKPFDPTALEELVQRYLKQNASVSQVSQDEVEEENSPETILPTMEEFDLDHALKYLGNVDIVKQTMLDFEETISREIDTLNMLIERIYEGEAIAEYRIHVHSLKSSSSMIGAVLLSKLARICEVAAIEGEREKLISLHPILIEELRKHKARLSVLKTEEEDDKPMLTSEETFEILGKLKTAALELDSNMADELIAGVKEKQVQKELAEDFNQLEQLFYNFQMDDAVELILNMLGRVMPEQ